MCRGMLAATGPSDPHKILSKVRLAVLGQAALEKALEIRATHIG